MLIEYVYILYIHILFTYSHIHTHTHTHTQMHIYQLRINLNLKHVCEFIWDAKKKQPFLWHGVVHFFIPIKKSWMCGVKLDWKQWNLNCSPVINYYRLILTFSHFFETLHYVHISILLHCIQDRWAMVAYFEFAVSYFHFEPSFHYILCMSPC